MVRVKKAEKATIFKNVIGANIKLDILLRNNVLNVTIFNSLYSVIYKKCIVLVILLSCNFFILMLNILNAKLVTAIFILVFLDFFKLCSAIREENLIIVRGLGFQVSTKSVLGVKTIFIPQEQVQKVFINEVIFRNKVIYILSFLIKDADIQEKLVPLFLGTLPRLACLKVIYKYVKTIQE